jgi:uncharacterized protein (TIGR01777 family)
MKVAITGGTGFLGLRLLECLRRHGHACTVLSRDPQRARLHGVPEGIPVSGLDSLPQGDAVVHLAGESPVGWWTRAKRRAILESRVEGTRRLVRAMAALPVRPRVLACASAVGIYGHRPGERLEEISALDPDRGFRHEVCRQWEEAALEAEALGIRVVLLRIGNVFSLEGGYVAEFLRLHRAGFRWGVGNPEASIAWIAVEDAVRLIAFALERETIRGAVNVTAPHPVTQRAFAEALAARFGRRLWGMVPGGMLRLGLGEFSRALVDDQRVIPSTALRERFVFQYPAWRLWADEWLTAPGLPPEGEAARSLG